MRSDLWADSEIALLGTATDKAVAQEIGRSEDATRKKRRQLGIPACRAVATGNQAAKRPWTMAELALLGAAADCEIAKRLGRSIAAVRAKRIRMEIESYTKPRGRQPKTPRRKNPML